MNILVSACLLGTPCRYNGTGCLSPQIVALRSSHRLIPICPEVLGGLATPRPPVELQQGQALTLSGQNCTAAFSKGAEEAHKIAKQNSCTHAILKSRSPSCGFGLIYDGSFSGKLMPGNGIAADLLYHAGLTIWNETQPLHELLIAEHTITLKENYIIRAFRPNDLDTVMELWLQSNLQAHGFIPKEYWEANFAAVKEMLPAADLFVYEQNGVVVAFAGLQQNYLAGIFVAPHLRSQGIGKQLLDFCKERHESLTLCVFEKNQKAYRFYVREGFLPGKSQIDQNTGEAELLLVWEKPK